MEEGDEQEAEGEGEDEHEDEHEGEHEVVVVVGTTSGEVGHEDEEFITAGDFKGNRSKFRQF